MSIFASENRKNPWKRGEKDKKIRKDNKFNKGAVKQWCQAVPLKNRERKSYDVNKFCNSAYARNGSSFSSLWTRFIEERPSRQLKKHEKLRLWKSISLKK